MAPSDELARARILREAELLASGMTVRAVGFQLGMPKSTVYTDLVARLPGIDPELGRRVRDALDANMAARCRRGGVATAEKRRREAEGQGLCR